MEMTIETGPGERAFRLVEGQCSPDAIRAAINYVAEAHAKLQKELRAIEEISATMEAAE